MEEAYHVQWNFYNPDSYYRNICAVRKDIYIPNVFQQHFKVVNPKNVCNLDGMYGSNSSELSEYHLFRCI